MNTVREFGLTGVRLAPGDHICALYWGQAERDRIVTPYLRSGLLAGDKCICIVDAADPWTFLDGIGSGIDVSGFLRSEQLVLKRSTDAYVRSGRFSSEAMLDFFADAMEQAISKERFAFARAAGDMSWVLRSPPGAEELIGYEWEVNRFAPRYPQALLCMYDLDRFNDGLILELLKTHPKLLLGGLMVDNPHHQAPA
jgi:DcmR-like sensory protein